MIEFYGKLSDECKTDRGLKETRMASVLLLVTAIVLGIPYIILEVIVNASVVRPIIIVSILLVIAGLLFFADKIKFFSKPAQYVNLFRVTVDEQSISNTNVLGDNKTRTRPIRKVRKIIDVGGWYYVTFRFADTWVCQKNLLKKGTLEEFEKIFARKIVKRKKKKSPIKE